MRALVLAFTLCTACFGYTPEAKRWSYVGNSVLIAAGGATAGAELVWGGASCLGDRCTENVSVVTGPLVAASMLITAGIVGIVLNATRPAARSESR